MHAGGLHADDQLRGDLAVAVAAGEEPEDLALAGRQPQRGLRGRRRAGVLAPRLQPYAERLATASRRAVAGNPDYVANPLIDSYHTVWFELHEELMGLCGLDRADEAIAGRAV